MVRKLRYACLTKFLARLSEFSDRGIESESRFYYPKNHISIYNMLKTQMLTLRTNLQIVSSCQSAMIQKLISEMISTTPKTYILIYDIARTTRWPPNTNLNLIANRSERSDLEFYLKNGFYACKNPYFDCSYANKCFS